MRTHGLLISALALGSSCTVIFPLDERDDGTGTSGASTTSQSGAGTGGGANEGGGGGVPDGGGGSGGEGCDPQPNFDEDPNNCGECGRPCGARPDGSPATCSAGSCELMRVDRLGSELPTDVLVAKNAQQEPELFYFATSGSGHRFARLPLDGVGIETTIDLGNAPLRVGGVALTSSGVVAALEIPGKAAVGDFLAFSEPLAPTSKVPLAELPIHHTAFLQVNGLEGVIRTDHEGGRLWATYRAGSSGPFEVNTLLAAASDAGAPLAVDAGYVGAWEVGTWQDAIFTTQLVADGGLYRWELEPFGVTEIATGNIVALAVDEAGADGHLYWADCTTGTILRGDLDNLEAAPVEMASAEEHPIALAAEPGEAGRLFVAETTEAARCTTYLNPGEGTTSRLFSVAKATGEERTLAVVDGAITRVVVADDDYVYVTIWNEMAVVGSIARIHR